MAAVRSRIREGLPERRISRLRVAERVGFEPGAAADIVAGIESHCDNAGIARVEELVGTLRV